jgi:ribosomal protein S12 methylthiotransferase
MAKIGFVSLGCPKNLVDSEVMMGLAVRDGLELTPRAEEADVLVINTCSFIQPAQKESIQTILEMAEHKKSGRARRLVVAGCLVARFRDEILKEIPEVDAVLNPQQVNRIVEACRSEGLFAPPEAEPYLYHDLTPRIRATPAHTAYIKIAEGCDHPCSFCIIPQLRGRFRSRRPESVIREAENLAVCGVREVTLIGQDTTSYGEDLGLRDGLPMLLERLAKVEGLHWVRFLYCYPNRLSKRLVETVAAHPRLAKYFDVPLQHSSARILKRMKRGGSGEAFLKRIAEIRKAIPGVAVRSSFIVGFPSETEEDFRELRDFVRAVEFDRLGVFGYSDQEGSGSFTFGEKVDPETIERRKVELMALQKKISLAKHRRLVGKTLTAMFEGTSEESNLVFEGRLESQAPEIDGKLYITELATCGEPALAGRTTNGQGVPRPGDLISVEITQAYPYDLVGRMTKQG